MAKYEKYAEYKDSGAQWLGDVPNHWGVEYSKWLFEERNIKATAQDEMLTASQKYGVIPQKMFMELEQQKVVQVLSGHDILKKAESNDFVISMRSFQGGIEFSEFSGAVSSAYVPLKPRDGLSLAYYKHLFKSAPYIQALQTTTNLVRDGQALRYGNFIQVRIPLVPLEEAKKIGHFLDHETAQIDTLITKQEKLIELLKEKRQGMISHAVTKGLNPDVSMKDSGVEWLGQVPEHWEGKPLKYLCTYNDDTLSETTPKETEIQYIDIGSVSAVNGISKIETMIFKDAPSRARRIVRDGDVIVSTVRTYLEAIASIDNPPENLVVSTGFIVIRPNQYLYKGFASYCLRAKGFIKEVIARSVGVSYPAINSSDLVNISIPSLEYCEQMEITNFLDSQTAKIDELIRKAESVIQLMQERRTALISSAVTGKIDVRNWQNPNKNNEEQTEINA